MLAIDTNDSGYGDNKLILQESVDDGPLIQQSKTHKLEVIIQPGTKITNNEKNAQSLKSSRRTRNDSKQVRPSPSYPTIPQQKNNIRSSLTSEDLQQILLEEPASKAKAARDEKRLPQIDSKQRHLSYDQNNQPRDKQVQKNASMGSMLANDRRQSEIETKRQVAALNYIN